MRNETNFPGGPEEREECVYTGWANQYIPSWWSVSKETPSPIPKPHHLVLTSLTDPQPHHFQHLLVGATYKPHHLFLVVFSQPGYLWLSEYSTQLSGEGAGDLTAHSPSDSTMKQSIFNRAEEPPGKFTANITSPWPGTPLFLDHPLSSTKHRHRYPSQNPPHLRKWDSPIPTPASSPHLTSSPKAQGLLLCHAEPGYPLVHLLWEVCFNLYF